MSVIFFCNVFTGMSTTTLWSCWSSFMLAKRRCPSNLYIVIKFIGSGACCFFRSITVVLPYMPYSKQCRMFRRSSVPMKLVADMICNSGLNQLLIIKKKLLNNLLIKEPHESYPWTYTAKRSKASSASPWTISAHPHSFSITSKKMFVRRTVQYKINYLFFIRFPTGRTLWLWPRIRESWTRPLHMRTGWDSVWDWIGSNKDNFDFRLRY